MAYDTTRSVEPAKSLHARASRPNLVDTGKVATKLQTDAAAAFVTSWNELLQRIKAQRAAVA